MDNVRIPLFPVSLCRLHSAKLGAELGTLDAGVGVWGDYDLAARRSTCEQVGGLRVSVLCCLISRALLLIWPGVWFEWQCLIVLVGNRDSRLSDKFHPSRFKHLISCLSHAGSGSRRSCLSSVLGQCAGSRITRQCGTSVPTLAARAGEGLFLFYPLV